MPRRRCALGDGEQLDPAAGGGDHAGELSSLPRRPARRRCAAPLAPNSFSAATTSMRSCGSAPSAARGRRRGAPARAGRCARPQPTEVGAASSLATAHRPRAGAAVARARGRAAPRRPSILVGALQVLEHPPVEAQAVPRLGEVGGQRHHRLPRRVAIEVGIVAAGGGAAATH